MWAECCDDGGLKFTDNKYKRNEEIFKEELVVLDYLIYEYKKELKRTTKVFGKNYKATKKSRLHRLRLEINKLLKYIENDLPNQYYCEVNKLEEE